MQQYRIIKLLKSSAYKNFTYLNQRGGGKICYKTITTKKASSVLYCITTDWIDETDSWISGTRFSQPVVYQQCKNLATVV